MGEVIFKWLANYFYVILYLFTYLFLPLFSYTSLIVFFSLSLLSFHFFRYTLFVLRFHTARNNATLSFFMLDHFSKSVYLNWPP